MDFKWLYLMVFTAGVSFSLQNQTVEEHEGHNVTLQCPTHTHINLENHTLACGRVGDHTDGAKSFIFSRRRGLDHPQPPMDGYRNRTSVSLEDLRMGLVSVQITSAQLEDGGEFKCYIPKMNISCYFTVFIKKHNGTSGKNEFGAITPGVNNTSDPGPVNKQRDLIVAIITPILVVAVIIIIVVFVKFRKKRKLKMSRAGWSPVNLEAVGTGDESRKRKTNEAEGNGVKPAAGETGQLST